MSAPAPPHPAVEALWAEWEAECRARTPLSAARAAGPEAGRLPDSQRHYFNSGIPYPIYVDRGEGCRVWDIDGNEYLDYAAGWNSGILGWGNKRVAEAVYQSMLRYGGTGGNPLPSPDRDRVTELLRERIPGAEKVAFTVSGSEANSFAIRFARAFTGREKIMKFRGAYHGTHDELVMGTLPTAGITADTAGHVVLATFNDREDTEAVLTRHAHELAAVVTEPILCAAGNIEQRDGFLQFLRDLALRHDVLFIMDEVITGFRFAMGGAAEYYHITPPPDLTVMAKMLGGGLPLAAIAGRADILSTPMTYGNTMSYNNACHAAAAACLEQLRPELYPPMLALAATLRDGLRATLAELGIDAQVTGDGTGIGVHLVAVEVTNAETSHTMDLRLFNLLRLGMINRGLNWTTRAMGLTLPFTRADVDYTVDAFRRTLLAMKPAIAEAAPELLRV